MVRTEIDNTPGLPFLHIHVRSGIDITPDLPFLHIHVRSGIDITPDLPFLHIHVRSGIDITPDLPFLHIHYPFTNERITVYLDKHSRMPLDTKDYFVKQISHLCKVVVIVASTSILVQFMKI